MLSISDKIGIVSRESGRIIKSIQNKEAMQDASNRLAIIARLLKILKYILPSRNHHVVAINHADLVDDYDIRKIFARCRIIAQHRVQVICPCLIDIAAKAKDAPHCSIE